MNKQEAIEIIEQSKIKIANRGRVIFKAGEIIVENVQVDYVPLEVVVNTIDQIHEPQKVVVPKFVAEWIESEKSRKRRLSQALSSVFDELELSLYIKQQLGDYTEIIARAWLDGYEVDQEQLYTVEIPNPNLNAHTILQKAEKGLALVVVTNARWRGWADSQLTESEIKEDFEWAWQFAKEVE